MKKEKKKKDIKFNPVDYDYMDDMPRGNPLVSFIFFVELKKLMRRKAINLAKRFSEKAKDESTHDGR